ncbi:MAG: NAD(P)/FAD-dependent oxidoreductase [Marinilabiliaceae bacterium]|nr:NAD(P)/FAD-dependent oxidoreductase [Marinilabiliaceae bacterium]
MDLNNRYDIVIIGSGLGGLACGSILSRKGYKVCVLEKNYQIGGCLQDFKRDGVLFETGMHFIGSYDDGQILNTLFRYFGIYDKIEVKKLDINAFDVYCLNGKEFQIPVGIENFRQKLFDQFPSEKSAIDIYFKRLIEIYNSVNILNLSEVWEDMPVERYGVGENVYEFISQITNNEELKNILGCFNSLYAGKKESASLFIHSIISLFYLQSAYKLNGGSGQIARELSDVIVKNGGVVNTSSKVSSLICDDGLVKKIELENGDCYSADYVISNIDPLSTFNMLKNANLRKAFISRIEEQKQTISSFSIYIALKNKVLPYVNSNYYYYETEDIWALNSYNEDSWPAGYMMYMNKSKEFDGYAESMVLISPMKFREMEKWYDTFVEKRGEDYLNMKSVKQERLLTLLEKKIPDIREFIVNVYSSSPLTYRDYTGVREGAMYGVETDSRNPFVSQILPKTRVRNLLLTGQNINMHGVLGVSIGAIHTCAELLGINNIIAELKTYKK